MPRILWSLRHHRPIVEVALSPNAGGPPLVRRLIADTGAGTAQSGFELLLHENDCPLCGVMRSIPVTLAGAYTGTFPVYMVRIPIAALGFDRYLHAAAVPSIPAWFDGIAGFRFLSRFAYGNFGDPRRFGLES
jgi:hypothetical protein